MISITEFSGFKTSDGKTFVTREAAETYTRTRNIELLLEKVLANRFGEDLYRIRELAFWMAEEPEKYIAALQGKAA